MAIPKVIDFGIAKAINQRLTEKTLFTRYAHIIGTPAYMSPEQAELSDVDVDTRTDIYSLGVLLYELLTGTTPFGEEELRKAGYIEMQRIIRESEPLKPSTKLSTMGDALAGVAEHRKTKPDLLAKLVRGDLDWIVMKSLEKDRARRYEAADRLALDIQRHLEHRPVLAHAPSTSYRLHKFLRRHRWQAIAALAMVVVAGTITILSIRNRYQVRLAEAEGARQVSALSEARKTLRPLLESEHAGLEARILFAGVIVGGNAPDEVLKGTEAIMERHYRKRVQFYSEKIQANPADANNYLQRAQQYHYLHEEQNVHSDMVKYAAILCGGRSSDLRFGTPVNLGSVVNGPSSSEQISCISHDGLEMYISWGTPEVDWEICVSRRATTHSDWGPPENLGPVVNTQYEESCACMSADGLTLYFNSNRPGGYGGFDIYMTTRATQNDTWGAPVNVGPGVNGYASDAAPWITTDGLELYFTSSRPGGYGRADIYVTKRATESDPWGEPVNLGPVVNSEYHDYFPSLSPDGLLLFFSDNIEGLPRPGGFGDSDLWVSMRPTTQDSWGAPVDLGPQVNGPYTEHGPRVSPDGLTLYFSSRVRPGGYGRWDIWQAPILPVGDFNTDGIVK